MGVMKYGDGRIYEGYWDQNCYSKGYIKHVDGQEYNGQFINNKPHGFGVQTINGFEYIGQFKKGLKHGNIEMRGKYVTFKGKFENDMINGYGIYHNTQTKEKYEGDFLYNQYHGQGCLT